MEFEQEVQTFILLADRKELRMLMVGGGAVNFHGYQRHSADVDFWIDTSPSNLEILKNILHELGYTFNAFPEAVSEGKQNISIKISPFQEIELITRFDPGKTFDEAWESAEITQLNNIPVAKYRVLNYKDLLESKLRSRRPKDLLDIQELERIRKN